MDIYIYIQAVKTIWKIKSEEQVNIANSQKVKMLSSDMFPLSLKTYAYGC